jgi:SAM-dependent methyltransferase
MGDTRPTAEHMRRFWDARAREDALYFVDNTGAYRHMDVDAFFEGGREQLDALFAQTGSAVAATDVVVDLGCGVGRLTRVLASRAAHVHAIDVSAEMLDRARQLNGDLDDVTWHHGDGLSLRPLQDGSADAVVSHVVFQHIPDPEITYGYVREIGRVLRPGGWATFHVSNDPGLHDGRHKPASRLKVLLGRAPKGQRDPAWRGSAVDLDRLTAAAADGGLEPVTVVGRGTQFCYVRLVKTPA